GHTTEAKKLIREDEIWKISNTKTDKDFTQQNHKLKLKHILKIQYVLKPFMEKNRYPLEKGMYMRFYDVYRSLLKNL
ncbi:MAG: glucan phosphorylase, partial [Granulosicoccus sp.]